MSGSLDGTVRVWNSESGEEVHRYILSEHEDEVKSVIFSADGKQLASGSKDGTIQLWCLLESALSEASGVHYEEEVLGTFILRWSSHPSSTLVLQEAHIGGVTGLSSMNQKLLKQRGTKGTPLLSDELPNLAKAGGIIPQTHSSSQLSSVGFFSSSALFVQQELRRLDTQHSGSDTAAWKQFVDWYLCREVSEEECDEESRQKKSLARIRGSTEQGTNILASAQAILTGQQPPQHAVSIDTDVRQQSPSRSPSSLFTPAAANQLIAKEKEEEDEEEKQDEKVFEC